MGLELERLQVGPWPMNCYLIRCRESGQVAIVDPGDDAEQILATAGPHVCCILLTHGHPDHVGALDAVRRATGAPVGIHPADAEPASPGALDVEADSNGLVRFRHALQAGKVLYERKSKS